MGSSWTATRNQRHVENNDKIGNERELFYPPDEDIDSEAELISAAYSGYLYSERELLDLWANDWLRLKGHFYPLYLACQNGRFEVAVLLLGK